MDTALIGSLMKMIGGLLVITYKDYALKKGWPVGALFASDVSWLTFIGTLSILVGFVELFFLIKWYLAIISSLGVVAASSIIANIFKEKTQYVSILLLIASIVVYSILGASIIRV